MLYRELLDLGPLGTAREGPEENWVSYCKTRRTDGMGKGGRLRVGFWEEGHRKRLQRQSSGSNGIARGLGMGKKL